MKTWQSPAGLMRDLTKHAFQKWFQSKKSGKLLTSFHEGGQNSWYQIGEKRRWGGGGRGREAGRDEENKRQKQQQQKKLNQNEALQSSLWKQKSLWYLKLCLPLVTTLTMSRLPHRLQLALFSWGGEASVDKQARSFPLKTQMGAPVWGGVLTVMNGTSSWFNLLGLRASSAAYHEAARALLKRCARALTCTMRVREPQVAVGGEQELPSALALCLAEGALATAVLAPMKTLVLRECGFSSKTKASAKELLAMKGWGCIQY